MKKYCFILLLIGGCSQELPDKENTVTVSGITERDSYAQLIGTTDESDWKSDEEWVKLEADLFESLALEELNNSQLSEEDKQKALQETQNQVGVHAAYPNPFASYVNIAVSGEPTPDFFEVVVVSEKLEVIEKRSLDKFLDIRLIMSENEAYVKGQLYRVYYIYKLPDYPFIFKGHGDLKYL